MTCKRIREDLGRGGGIGDQVARRHESLVVINLARPIARRSRPSICRAAGKPTGSICRLGLYRFTSGLMANPGGAPGMPSISKKSAAEIDGAMATSLEPQ